ncbi:MAG: putative bifunctional diguanylate cyclase/phosphodiesterase [Rhizobiaceae bacterium]
MAEQRSESATGKLIVIIKSAYWIALAIIAMMAMASYILLQQMMTEHRADLRLLSLISEQKALSQRVIFLSNAIDEAPGAGKFQLVRALVAANNAFESSYSRLLASLDAETRNDGKDETAAVARVLHDAPYRLDAHSTSLAANARGLAAVLESQAAGFGGAGSVEAARSHLNEDAARSTLAGYSALEQRMSELADGRLDRMLSLHLYLFYATMGIIILVALFIFRPMSEMIRRRTTDLIDAHNSMAFIAVHDGLTGLYNRAFLIDHFDSLLKVAARRRERLAVLQLDLDRFKQINDTLGHAAGDFVLVKTAERMRASCRASDLCVRLGGDEFVMILNAAGSTEDINALARRILDKVNEPMDFGGATIHPGASGGIAVYPVDADNREDLLVHADLALYSAKRLGGGHFSFFSDELRKELDHRKQLEHDLREAIAAKAFSVHFQPQVSLASSTVAGVEALARWEHPGRGLVPPSEFIPVAEKAKLMAQIGRIVIDKAIAQAADWYRAGTEFGRLAVNVSGAELREPDFAAFLFRTLEEHGLPPKRLSLEIVESVILDDEKTGIASTLRAIRKAGVHLELDDFGTGYASLSHVNPNEIDRLKIDRRFVQNIDSNDDNTKIVRAITELARGLGISIIAEGAETEGELNSLLALGCEHVQGYSIAFPMPGRQAGEWLEGRMHRKPKFTVHEGRRA